MNDDTPRLIKIGDALSQLFNVTFLPNHKGTNANESISGRSYRQGWRKAERFINWLLYLWEEDHCRKSYEKDLWRAEQLTKRAKDNNGSDDH